MGRTDPEGTGTEAQVPCPHCDGTGQGHFTDDGMPEVCPTCRGTGRAPAPEAPVAVPPEPQRASRGAALLLAAGAGVVAVALALIALIHSCRGAGERPGEGVPGLSGAARTLLVERVLPPGAAPEFPPPGEDRVMPLPEGRYLVSSHVDVHEEKAGTVIRRRYTLVLRPDGAGGWAMESVTLVP